MNTLASSDNVPVIPVSHVKQASCLLHWLSKFMLKPNNCFDYEHLADTIMKILLVLSNLNRIENIISLQARERSGSVVECLTGD